MGRLREFFRCMNTPDVQRNALEKEAWLRDIDERSFPAPDGWLLVRPSEGEDFLLMFRQEDREPFHESFYRGFTKHGPYGLDCPSPFRRSYGFYPTDEGVDVCQHRHGGLSLALSEFPHTDQRRIATVADREEAIERVLREERSIRDASEKLARNKKMLFS